MFIVQTVDKVHFRPQTTAVTNTGSHCGGQFHGHTLWIGDWAFICVHSRHVGFGKWVKIWMINTFLQDFSHKDF